MDSELDQLAQAATELARSAAGRVEVSSRACRLAERLTRGRFNISVLGEFKRGKSTIVNALVGQELLPTGVVPLTAVATEVAFGEEGATVVHLDGTTMDIGVGELADFVTEARNPDNQRQVARVEVRAPAQILQPGVVLVDTPGIGSIFRHNDEAATRALLDADGAILVLSADAPLSEPERRLLAALSDRRAPTFFVLNKVDHLTPAEREEVRRFVTEAVAGELGRKERLWCVDGRAALTARLAGRDLDEGDAVDFPEFTRALARFVEADLVEARLETARRELGRLARGLEDALRLEAGAAVLDAESLTRRLAEFQAAAEEQRRAFADERTLLERDVAALAEAISGRLFDFARREPPNWEGRLVEVARTAPVRRLEEELHHAVEVAVRVGFEAFRRAEAERAEQAWSRLAEQLRSRAQARINAVRTAASGLFSVSLPEMAIPEVAEEREQYFHLFLHVGSSSEDLGRVLRHLLPASVVRRRLLDRARRELAAEFDKHAGRARWDLDQRLGAVRRRFELTMVEELDQSVQTILAAARRAEELRSAADSDLERRRQEGEAARRATSAALTLAQGG